MFVSDILAKKGGLVYTVTPGTTLSQVSRQLSTRRIGSVLVIDRLDRLAGIVSE
jgi:CBS domain-containing protein